MRLLLDADEMLDLVPRVRGDDEVQPVAARLVAGRRDDLDDVAVLEPRAERHHLAVDARAHALPADVGMNRIREIDRRGAPRKGFDLPLGREGVDLLRIEVDLQVLDELLRIADLVLELEQLPHPLEIALVALVADAPFLVFPVRRNAFFGPPVHLDRPDLHLEGHAVMADDRGVERLIAVGPRHRDEVLDPSGHRRPGLMDDAERRVAVLHAFGDDPERDEVVHLLELDLLTSELLMDAPQPLDATVDLDHGDLRFGELAGDGRLQLLDEPFGRAPLGVDADPERLVGLRLEVAERQLLELVLHLAHAEPVGDRRVDVARLLGDLDPPLLRQMAERPHVVQAVGQLHQDHADVVDHREQHLAEVLRLPLLARRKRDGADLRHAFDDVGDLGAEELFDPLDRGQRVFHDVVQQPGGNRHRVELHVGQEVGDGKRVDKVGLSGVTDLSPMLEGGEDVRPPQQLDVGVRAVGPNLLQEVLEANHENRCLNCYRARFGREPRYVV